jgi:hypothetical protein
VDFHHSLRLPEKLVQVHTQRFTIPTSPRVDILKVQATNKSLSAVLLSATYQADRTQMNLYWLHQIEQETRLFLTTIIGYHFILHFEVGGIYHRPFHNFRVGIFL